ncbi:hypothetical protein OC846_003821 [Tilletia horrida]|uniref:t-SNARE coiled-coil homology domain-containing protein n=1 Tax=Tilletia horrida TaxID=155126 RepID=A0AAN6JXK9_9BASI|nr:hypothetical protein OC846_003821 [Tilletia horrida]KAK0565082.1 hypothetical protein OC861_003942 [Tilletia horrida]
MSSTSAMASVSRLSSLSNTTLTQLHERTRALSLSANGKAPPSTNRSIQRNLNSLAKGITDLEAQLPTLGPAARKEVAGLRRLWERLTGMLEADEEGQRMLAVVKESHPAIATQLAEVQPPSASRFPSTGLSRTSQTRQSDQAPYRDNPEDAYKDDERATSPTPASPPLQSEQIYASQQQAMRDQDGQLETLSASVGRQRELGLQMNEELELQHELIQDLEGGVDGTELRLGRASRRLDQVAKSLKEHGSTWTILGLIVILVFLIAVLR